MNFCQTSSSLNLIHFRTQILLVVSAFTLGISIFDFPFQRRFWASRVFEGIVNWIQARLWGCPAVEGRGAEELRHAVTAHEGVDPARAPVGGPHHLLGAQVLLILEPCHQKIQEEQNQSDLCLIFETM